MRRMSGTKMWGNKKYVNPAITELYVRSLHKKMRGNTDEVFDIFGLKFLHINLYLLHEVEYGG